MFRFARHNKETPSAFSLLEITVVLALVAVSLMAIIALVNKVLQVENVTANDFIAKGLLTEGVELAEAKRNANVAVPQAFYSNLMSASPVNGTIYTMRIDYNGDSTEIGSGGNGLVTAATARLQYDASNFYQYAPGTPSLFYRMLKNTYHIADGRDWLEVECQVYWSEHGHGSTQKMTMMLYNTAP